MIDPVRCPGCEAMITRIVIDKRITCPCGAIGHFKEVETGVLGWFWILPRARDSKEIGYASGVHFSSGRRDI